MVKKIVRMVALVIAVFGLGAATMTAPASAGQAGALAWECAVGTSCYYTGSNGTGSRWVAPTGGCHHPLPAGFRDSISSVYNNGHGHAHVHLYNWVGYWDHIATIAPGTKANLGSGVNNMTDRVCIDV